MYSPVYLHVRDHLLSIVRDHQLLIARPLKTCGTPTRFCYVCPCAYLRVLCQYIVIRCFFLAHMLTHTQASVYTYVIQTE